MYSDGTFSPFHLPHSSTSPLLPISCIVCLSPSLPPTNLSLTPQQSPFLFLPPSHRSPPSLSFLPPSYSIPFPLINLLCHLSLTVSFITFHPTCIISSFTSFLLIYRVSCIIITSFHPHNHFPFSCILLSSTISPLLLYYSTLPLSPVCITNLLSFILLVHTHARP